MRSSIQHYGAHEQGSETSCLCFAHDNQTLISRGGEIIKSLLPTSHYVHVQMDGQTTNTVYNFYLGDDTLKLWDIRSFKRPVNVVTGLDNMFAGTDCVFSPDEQTIMTGVSVKKGEVMR